jgi:hypothetical protein
MHVSDYPGVPQDVNLSSYDEYSSLQIFRNLEQMAQDVILLENTLNATMLFVSIWIVINLSESRLFPILLCNHELVETSS